MASDRRKTRRGEPRAGLLRPVYRDGGDRWHGSRLRLRAFFGVHQKAPGGAKRAPDDRRGRIHQGDGAVARSFFAFNEPAGDRRHRSPVSVTADADLHNSRKRSHSRFAAAQRLAALAPVVELHDGVVEKRSGENLKEHWDPDEWAAAEPAIADVFAGFLKRTEGQGPVAVSSGRDTSPVDRAFENKSRK